MFSFNKSCHSHGVSSQPKKSGLRQQARQLPESLLQKKNDPKEDVHEQMEQGKQFKGTLNWNRNSGHCTRKIGNNVGTLYVSEFLEMKRKKINKCINKTNKQKTLSRKHH